MPRSCGLFPGIHCNQRAIIMYTVCNTLVTNCNTHDVVFSSSFFLSFFLVVVFCPFLVKLSTCVFVCFFGECVDCKGLLRAPSAQLRRRRYTVRWPHSWLVGWLVGWHITQPEMSWEREYDTAAHCRCPRNGTLFLMAIWVFICEQLTLWGLHNK